MSLPREAYQIAWIVAAFALISELRLLQKELKKTRQGTKEFKENEWSAMDRGEKMDLEERLAALEGNQKMVFKTQDRILGILESRSTRWNQGASE